MIPTRASSEARWDARIARARTLGATHPAAHDALAFYAALAGYQKSLVISAEPVEAVPVDAVLAGIPAFLTWLTREAHPPLASLAVEMARSDRDAWRRVLESLDSEVEPSERAMQFVAEALLQPFAELATSSGGNDRFELDTFPVHCPDCGALPVVGALREEGQGAKRMLTCALCLRERDYLRAVCPGCGEQRFDALPVYTADRFEHVRIEACDSCRRYLKTIDLTKDGLAIPLVDDIASVSLDLWAREQGYFRLRENLFAF